MITITKQEIEIIVLIIKVEIINSIWNFNEWNYYNSN